MTRSSRGRFIVLEGLDGAGTTTQAQWLSGWLRARGRKVHATAEPSRGPVGAMLRSVLSGRLVGAGNSGFDARAVALLFAADRLDHWASEIEPRLAEGCDVVSDRYVLSSLAYQAVSTGDARWVAQVNAKAPQADLTLFLAVRPSVALRRRFAATADREIYETPRFQERVHRAYRRALRTLGGRVEEIPGERPVEEVSRLVVRALERLLR
ncbi:MAG TPA: dTMP kinase [Anaeromyxobacteraceae bacterium]|nr:dTMP kinase [Anaeromyxobacteraceae bacterium]